MHSITIERILVNREYNDFGLLVRDRLMILFEAQSVSDDNIPWRFFFYWADECKKYIEDNHLSLHGSKTVYLPRPEFYMIYCGEDDVPDVLHLSALFKGGYGRNRSRHIEQVIRGPKWTPRYFLPISPH